jgi:hypothetical protein
MFIFENFILFTCQNPKWLFGMVREKVRSYLIIAGLVSIVAGAVLAFSSRPVFTMMRDEVQEVPRSVTIMNYPFNVHQSQDKLVEFQISIGQKLSILAAGSGDFNFSIANFTETSHLVQPDQPDVTYVSMENTTSVNTTWSPTVRSAQPGSYYLVFLARNASSDSPVEIIANVTKIWTDIQTHGVPYQTSLIDADFAYLGLGIAVFGAMIFFAAWYPRKTRRSHSRER